MQHNAIDGARVTPPPRFHIRTLGCKVNQAESDRIAAALAEAGFAASAAAEADVCIVNTCTVTGEADTKNRKVIRQLLRAFGGPVIVTGCAVNVDSGFYRDLSTRIVVEREKDAVAALASKMLAPDRDGHAAGAAAGGEDSRVDSRRRTRASVKVQDGCDNSCSFCIVHTARGPARSVPARDVLADVAQRCGNTPELVLVGIDLGAYNDSGTDLAGLLRLLQDRTAVGRIRITSIEPQSLTASLVDELAASSGRVCRHVHLCLQSGSSKVLQEMNRNYSAEDFTALVDKLRSRIPGVALSTDVIAGFPGETDEDFEQTCRLVERCGFMRLHVFRYSKRPGTPAAARLDQVDPKVIAARSKQLISLGERLAAQDIERRVGTRELVVVERPGLGTSESYHAARCDESLPPGALVSMEFTGVDGNALIGKASQR